MCRCPQCMNGGMCVEMASWMPAHNQRVPFNPTNIAHMNHITISCKVHEHDNLVVRHMDQQGILLTHDIVHSMRELFASIDRMNDVAEAPVQQELKI